MGLAEYGRKRHFDKTSEPAPKKPVKRGWSYVIQKHDASRLHYDFRLELDGVLLSWAVPKGPSLDPSVKRLAIQVEDHPVAYGSFEGTIPQDEYGGGTVMLWDRGDWEPVGNPQTGVRNGKLNFVLHGEKLHGTWSLVRTRRTGPTNDARQWLLIKGRDEDALPASQGDILEAQPLSVASHRDLDAIAGARGRVWSSDRGTEKKTTKLSTSKRSNPNRAASSSHATKRKKTQARSAPMPDRIDVELATLTDYPPESDEWLHEIKFDGYRMICRIDDGDVQFVTRNHNDWTRRLASLVTAVRQLPCKQAILDGEIVVVLPDGTTDFQALQNAFRDGRTDTLKYYLFDLLYLDGHDLTQHPLEERKDVLKALLDHVRTEDAIRYSDHVLGNGDEFKQQACRLHLEGMVSKRRDRPYRPGRGDDWLKVKCIRNEEFVIGGFTEPSGSRTGFGALLVGFFDSNGELHYAGKVGTGFDARTLKAMSSRLKSLEQETSPFVDLKRKVGSANQAHWVRPELVGQFKFGSRTRDNKLRHASFQGLREDKPADEVKLETSVPIAKIPQAAGPSKSSNLKKQRNSSAITVDHVDRKSAMKSRRNRPAPKKMLNQTLAEYDAASETVAGARLTHPDKIVYPDSGITKLEVAQYYHAVAKWILPVLAHRPLVLVRCPEGSEKECFYQKHPGVGTPKTLRQILIEESHKTANYVVVDDQQGLLALTQLGTLEIHVWGSREDNLEKPDRLIFDLDPDPAVTWPRVIESARQIREFLQQLGLESFVKTTGGKGLHLVVPIERRHSWPQVKNFCKQVADLVTQADPARYTANMSKAARTNKIFIDYLRNQRGATAVAAFSTRARPKATVSMPIAWDELTAKLTSDHFTIKNAVTRLKTLDRDPWQGFESKKQSLSEPIKQLKSLIGERGM